MPNMCHTLCAQQAAAWDHLQHGLLRPKVPGAVLLKAQLDPTLALRCAEPVLVCFWCARCKDRCQVL